MAKATALVKAYLNEEIPSAGGFIVSAFFEPGSVYGVYEVTAYRNVKDIYRTQDGIIFKTDGNRANMLVEPATYYKKHTEPVNREANRSIPYRFNECERIDGSKHEKIFVGKEPLMLYSSFTILEQEGDYFSFVFFPTPDVYSALKRFLVDSLYNDCDVSRKSANEAVSALLETIKKFSVWEK